MSPDPAGPHDTPESPEAPGGSGGPEDSGDSGATAEDPSPGEEGSSSYRPRRPRSGRRPGGGFLIPAWVVVPLAAGAGFLTAGWPGAVFGLIVGIFLWRIRSG